MVVHEIKQESDLLAALADAANKAVVLDASASWCGPCKRIAPIFDKWSEKEEYKGVYFAKFDVDELETLAQKLGVRAMPTFNVLKNDGTIVAAEDAAKAEKELNEYVVDTFVGVNPPPLEALIKKHAA